MSGSELDNEERRVIVEVVRGEVGDGAHDGAADGVGGGRRAASGGDEACVAELFAGGAEGLGNAIGGEQQEIVGPESDGLIGEGGCGQHAQDGTAAGQGEDVRAAEK